MSLDAHRIYVIKGLTYGEVHMAFTVYTVRIPVILFYKIFLEYGKHSWYNVHLSELQFLPYRVQKFQLKFCVEFPLL